MREFVFRRGWDLRCIFVDVCIAGVVKQKQRGAYASYLRQPDCAPLRTLLLSPGLVTNLKKKHKEKTLRD